MLGSGANSVHPSDTVITAVRPSRIAPMWRIKSCRLSSTSRSRRAGSSSGPAPDGFPSMVWAGGKHCGVQVSSRRARRRSESRWPQTQCLRSPSSITLRAAAERDLRRAHLRRHDADQVVGPHDPRQQIDQRLLDVVGEPRRSTARCRGRGRTRGAADRPRAGWPPSTDVGSDRSSCGPPVRTTMCSKLSIFCGALSS